ncbi:YafY family protein [Herbivorax sp. ANBcel31]|uniref:helix-turn-helix transcriptional regulator n=1 Tax=Herbivorax sp. ANBcel31 TaxID=3069754 RepID=UPI0027B458A1|nr:YafY family protein [Herbivorax sp. ANBcel31]MDQ2086308.1 YafY family protein [Herbivorax sp. ANBcel31]
MQINRIIEMVYILLDKKTVTAKELAEHFEVSQRTIYRDVDILSSAGIPIYAMKGKGGGISILDNFVLNKSMLSEKEQMDILSSLQSLKALNALDIDPVLKKLGVIFGKDNTSWIDVDFSRWGSSAEEKDRFNIFKEAILNKKVVSFEYYNSYGEKTNRAVEPLKLVFKGYAWYVYAFCCVKEDFRMFKVSRIKKIVMIDKSFARSSPKKVTLDYNETDARTIKVVLRINRKMAFRIFDEFDRECVSENQDGSFKVTSFLPDEDWVYGYILSFGNFAEVLEPKHIREGLKDKLEECLKKYS